jgi:hypothetical protein
VENNAGGRYMPPPALCQPCEWQNPLREPKL